jgi:hypothetical protein
MKLEKAVEHISNLISARNFIWAFGGIALVSMLFALSSVEDSSSEDQSTLQIMGPKTFARVAVNKAEFRAAVRQIQAGIAMQNTDLIAHWQKNLVHADCEEIELKGYSLKPTCIEKQAFKLEIIKRGICHNDQSSFFCGDKK